MRIKKLANLVNRRNQLRSQGKKMNKRNLRSEQHHAVKHLTCRVMTNIAKPWFGKQPMTPNMWRD